MYKCRNDLHKVTVCRYENTKRSLNLVYAEYFWFNEKIMFNDFFLIVFVCLLLLTKQILTMIGIYIIFLNKMYSWKQSVV